MYDFKDNCKEKCTCYFSIWTGELYQLQSGKGEKLSVAKYGWTTCSIITMVCSTRAFCERSLEAGVMKLAQRHAQMMGFLGTD